MRSGSLLSHFHVYVILGLRLVTGSRHEVSEHEDSTRHMSLEALDQSQLLEDLQRQRPQRIALTGHDVATAVGLLETTDYPRGWLLDYIGLSVMRLTRKMNRYKAWVQLKYSLAKVDDNSTDKWFDFFKRYYILDLTDLVKGALGMWKKAMDKVTVSEKSKGSLKEALGSWPPELLEEALSWIDGVDDSMKAYWVKCLRVGHLALKDLPNHHPQNKKNMSLTGLGMAEWVEQGVLSLLAKDPNQTQVYKSACEARKQRLEWDLSRVSEDVEAEAAALTAEMPYREAQLEDSYLASIYKLSAEAVKPWLKTPEAN